MVTGSLQKKGSTYYAVICFNNNGNQTQKWISSKISTESGNKRKAQAFLKAKIEEYENIEDSDATRILFCDFLADWVEIRKMSIAPSTHSYYLGMLKNATAYFKKLKITLTNLTALHISRYITHLMKTVSPNTAIKFLGFIRTALDYAVKMKMVKENVAYLVEKPKKQKFNSNHYSLAEINQLLKVIKGETIEIPVTLVAYLGLRRSEVVGLRWSAIDLENRKLTIQHKVVHINDAGKYRLYASDNLKNSSSYRSLPLGENLYNYLLNVKTNQEENKKLYGNSYNYDFEDYVCVDDLGNLINPNYISCKFGKILKKYNMRHIRFHDLRHSSASLLLSMGYNMKNIQLWLGHGDIGTTMNIYVHIDDSAKVEMMDGLSQVLN